jgi:4-hydroxy-3-methylbut-2-enyl diphosphate reductase
MGKYDDTSERYAYTSALIKDLKASGGRLERGRVTIHVPEQSGFCWGVDRALAMIDDALRENPDRRVWLLNQIIHNPIVNRDLKARGVHFLRGPFADGDGSFEQMNATDVAVVPAFSAEVEDLQELERRAIPVVDTTCPWVIKPHRRTERYVKDGFTTVIHGTAGHDETLASCSLIRHLGGHYLIVHDLVETDLLCAYLRGERELAHFAEDFAGKCSPGFDPAQHLSRIGMINQTTMLATESREVASRVAAAMRERDGEQVAESFRDFDTICRATQDNQDSFLKVLARTELDLLIVVGGFDSSNTKNLARIGDDAGIPSYHIERPEDLTATTIRHRRRKTGEIVVDEHWLPAGSVQIGMTAGASTPDTIFGAVVERVLAAAT